MKKIFLATLMFLLVGCGNLSNTPTKQVEDFLKKYQSLDNAVLTDLDDVIAAETTFNDDQKNKYRDIMKKHYQNLTYEIKDETLDGDEAIVTVEITVTDFNKVLDETSQYLISHPEEFNDDNGDYDIVKYNNYRLDRLKEANEKVKYTIAIPVTKVNNEWTVNKLNNTTLDKINGIYNY